MGVEKLKALLPKELSKKVDEIVESVRELVEGKASEFATDVYGRILGRGHTEEAWRSSTAEKVAAAEGKIGDVITKSTGRIAWVTKARGTVEKFDTVVAGLGFVALQVWDGFNDVEGLVRA